MLSAQSFHVRLEQNGEFFGLYSFLEQPDEEWLTRVGLDAEGAHYKAVSNAGCQTGTLAEITLQYEKKTRLYEDHSDLYQFLTDINGLTGQAQRDYIFDNVDLPPQLNYQAALVLFHENDAPYKNYYLYRDTEGTGRWFMLPWDKDLTWGRNYDGAVLNDQIWADVDSISGRTNVSPSHPLFMDQQHQKYDYLWNRCVDAYYAQPEIRTMFFRRLRTLMDELLVYPLHENRIDELVPLIDANSTGNEAALDAAKWGQYGTPQTLTEAVDILKNDYLAVRRPHLFGTHRVSGEIPELQASGLPVVITEIMYAPAGGTAHEFVELFNPSPSEALDLSGWTVEGLGLTIPPGTVLLPQAYLLLAYDDAAFRAEYGSGRFVAAEYENSLPTPGTSVVLRDQNGAEVDRVEYTNSAPWPSTPAGTGPSLELIDPDLDNNDAANWAASAGAGGTPGAFNSVSVPGAPPPELYINEVLPSNASVNQDAAGDFDPWIEIYNASPTAVELGGMHLSNDFLNPDLWRFPLGTTPVLGLLARGLGRQRALRGPAAHELRPEPSRGRGHPERRRAGGDRLRHLRHAGRRHLVGTAPGRRSHAGRAGGSQSGRRQQGRRAADPERVQRGVGHRIPEGRRLGQLLGNRRGQRRRLVRAAGHGRSPRHSGLAVPGQRRHRRGRRDDDPPHPDPACHLVRPARRHHHHGLRGSGRRRQLRSRLRATGGSTSRRPTAPRAPTSRPRASPSRTTTHRSRSSTRAARPSSARRARESSLRPASAAPRCSSWKRIRSSRITPVSNYNDGSSSSFGAPNIFNAGATVQDLTLLRSAVCFSDLDCDDANVCNGVETCDIPSATCLPGSCGASQIVLLDDDFETDFGNWSNVGGDDIDWTRDSGGTPSSGTGPLVDHTTGSSSGFYLYTEASGSGTGYPNKTALLQSPCIDLNGAIDATLTFWYHMVGTDMGTLYAEVAAGCGTSWTTEFSLSGSQQASQSDPYLQANIDLSAYVGTSIRLRLRGVTGSNYSGDMAVDDVQVTASALICGCDDAAFCNGQETCAGSTCVAGSPIDCEDGISCTTDVCNEGTRSCDQLPDDQLCDDGNPCNGSEICDLVLDCQPTGCDSQVDLIDQGFDTEAGEFAYQDDTFRGTSNPSFADGTYEAAGGQTGGGLRVQVGGNSTNMSGGWVASFDVVGLPTSVEVEVSFRLLFSGGYEADEFGEALLSVDGTLLGVDPNDYLFQQVGDGSTSWDSGWITETLSTSLAPGTHQITVGGFNNKSTVAGEITEVFFDDVRVTAFYGTSCECEDGDVCNGIETCSGGVCEPGTPLDCDDGVACTADLCDAIAGCQNPDTCVGGEACNLGSGLCEPKSCSGSPECDDGLYCNGVETCVVDVCAPGTAVVCDDGVGCTFDVCDEGLDACEFLPDHAACQNGVFCDGVELCDPVLDCQPGVAEDLRRRYRLHRRLVQRRRRRL